MNDIQTYIGSLSLLIVVHVLLKDDDRSRQLLALVANRSNMDVLELRTALASIQPSRKPSDKLEIGAPDWSPLEDLGYGLADTLSYMRSHSRYREDYDN